MSAVREVWLPAGAQALASSLRATWQRHLRARAPELALVIFGIVLRVLLLRVYRPQYGYDFVEHSVNVDWWAKHFAMPPLSLSRGAYHPQPFYALGGVIRRLGGGWVAVQATSVILGGLRLCLLAFALDRYLPRQRLARCVALWLAATIPVSVMMDAMVTQESLNNLISLGFLVVALELARTRPDRRMRCGVVLGLIGGAGLLVKVSDLVLLGVLGFGALLELVQRVDLRPYERWRQATPWLVAAGIAITLSSPQYVYNQRVHGKAFLDGWYQRPTADTIAVHAERLDLLDRRTAGFFLGLNADLTRYPYVPAGMKPVPRFFPQLIGSAFADYFHYGFSPAADVNRSLRRGLGLYRHVTSLARASQASGLVIAGVTVLTWLIVAYQTVRRREVARPLTLTLPLLGLVGAAYFATQYPYEFEGVIKAHYYHFAASPLYAVYGIGTAWLLRQRLTRILGAGACVCLIAPAAYSMVCIFR